MTDQPDNSGDSGKADKPGNSAKPSKPGNAGKKPRTPPTTARMILWVVAAAIGVYWLGSGIIGLISGGS